MNYWLMSIKWGKDGCYFNDLAKNEGLIAIGGYEEWDADLTEAKSQNEIDELINHSEGRKMLGIFRLKMKPGDIVYIKGNNKNRKVGGANIFGRCSITCPYKTNKKKNKSICNANTNILIKHIRYVKWDKDFGEPRRNTKEDTQILHKTIAKLSKKKVTKYCKNTS